MKHNYLGSKGRDSDNKYTPQHILDAVVTFGGGHIALDPCWALGCNVRADRVLTREDDGLAHKWPSAEEGVTWVNPPYSNMLAWVRKVVAEWYDSRAEILLLTNNSSDTEWYQDVARPNATAICYIRGRLKFLGHSNSNPWPSLIFYFGDRPLEFAMMFESIGYVEVL